jgi:hypothetical protein
LEPPHIRPVPHRIIARNEPESSSFESRIIASPYDTKD